MGNGYVDLHCHYVPGIDDGVRNEEESLALLKGLRLIGYTEVVATPHMRPGMFDNTRETIEKAFEAIGLKLEGQAIPTLSLGAEHFFDEVFLERLERKDVLPYRGKSSILIELHYEVWPQNFEVLLFRMQLKGLQPVIAHPERYRALFRRSDLLASALNRGAVALLDLMSLVGRYGESCQRAAERMLEEGLYDAACSDAHRPSDIEHVAKAIDRLHMLVGKEAAERLLGENPRRIAQGTYERDE